KPGETFRLGQSVVLECLYADDEGASPDATVYVPRAAAAGSPPPSGTPPSLQPSRQTVAAVPDAAFLGPDAAATLRALIAPEFEPRVSVTDEDFNQTVVMPRPAIVREQSRRIEEEGESITLPAQKPIFLNDPAAFYYVVSGAVLIFTVPLENGLPAG